MSLCKSFHILSTEQSESSVECFANASISMSRERERERSECVGACTCDCDRFDEVSRRIATSNEVTIEVCHCGYRE